MTCAHERTFPAPNHDGTDRICIECGETVPGKDDES